MKKNVTLLLFFCTAFFLIAGAIAAKQQAVSYPVATFGAVATASQSGHELAKVVDGDMNTLFHSPYSGYTLPDTLYFYFSDVSRIDSLIYYPRTDGGYNGRFGNTEIGYSSASSPSTFVKLADVDFGQPSSAVRLALNGSAGVLNPSCIRLIVKTGYGGFASCAEMQFSTVVEPVSVTPVSCDPGYQFPVLPADEQKSITGATATSFQPGTDITQSYDGDNATFYHSAWSGGDMPITLDYTVTGADQINYLVYTPRQDGGYNGRFEQTQIWYSKASDPSVFIKLCDYNFDAPSAATKLIFPTAAVNPAVIRVVVQSGYGGYASCAEMAFYKSYSYTVPSGIFSDDICSRIKPSVTQADVDAMDAGFFRNLAQCMLNQQHDTLYRVQNYEPYCTRTTLASNLKTGPYSPFENPTGIFFSAGETAVVLVGDTHGQSLSMRVYDYTSQADYTYALSAGVNIIPVTDKGLAYINYYTDNFASLQPVSIHIASGGQINGCYEAGKSTATDWRSMLTHAVTDMIDLKGHHIGMVYPVQYLKMYCPADGAKIIQIYDTVVRMEHEMMGLYKYNRVPKNHMYAEADNAAVFSWYAGSNGAHYSSNINVTCNDNIAVMDIWGIAHELGHVNQVRPGIRFTGVTEVTNNIYSSWIAHSLKSSPGNNRLETDYVNDGYYDGYETATGYGVGNVMTGGMFNAYLNNTILKKELWLNSYGSLSMKTSGTETWLSTGGDFFSRLCPLWQLELYYQVVHPDKKDWFADLAEKVRNTDESSLTNAQIHLNFIKNICDVTGEDLTDFFLKTGMLRVYDKPYFDDYGTNPVVITAADSLAAVNYIKGKGYPAPGSPFICYLTATNVNAFIDRQPVQGVAGIGCTYTNVSSDRNGYQNYVTVDNSQWRNVVIFKTYSGSSVTRLSMVGSGYADNSATRVYYPSDATAVYAVAYDGTESLVYPSSVATGLQKHEAGTLSVYPNPITEGFYTDGLTGTGTVRMFDVSGRLLLNRQVKPGDFVNVATLPQGTYFVTISSAGQTMHQTVIKK
jgi:hypothetical protein